MVSRITMAALTGTMYLHAQQAQRDEQRERGLRAVCGGAEGVQAEDGNAGDGADVLGALLAGGQRPAEEQIACVRPPS
jgi:hypothetical protein